MMVKEYKPVFIFSFLMFSSINNHALPLEYVTHENLYELASTSKMGSSLLSWAGSADMEDT